MRVAFVEFEPVLVGDDARSKCGFDGIPVAVDGRYRYMPANPVSGIFMKWLTLNEGASVVLTGGWGDMPVREIARRAQLPIIGEAMFSKHEPKSETIERWVAAAGGSLDYVVLGHDFAGTEEQMKRFVRVCQARAFGRPELAAAIAILRGEFQA